MEYLSRYPEVSSNFVVSRVSRVRSVNKYKFRLWWFSKKKKGVRIDDGVYLYHVALWTFALRYRDCSGTMDFVLENSRVSCRLVGTTYLACFLFPFVEAFALSQAFVSFLERTTSRTSVNQSQFQFFASFPS